MIDWDSWNTVLAVFRNGTYADTAKAIKLDPSTVGRRIKTLERRLGYKLFFRDNDRLKPTGNCERLLAYIEEAADALHSAEHHSSSLKPISTWREIRISAQPFLISNFFAPNLGEISARRSVKFDLIETASEAMLTRREADISIRIANDKHEFDLSADWIDTTFLGNLDYAVFASQDADPDQLPWAGLSEQYILEPGHKIIVDLAGPEGFRYKAVQFRTLLEIAAAGLARVMLPTSVAGIDPRLKCCSDTLMSQPIWMLNHKQDREVPHLRAAREWIESLAVRRLTKVEGQT